MRRTAEDKAQSRTTNAAFYPEDILKQYFGMLDPSGLGWAKGIIARCKGPSTVQSEEGAGEGEKEREEKQWQGIDEEEGRGGQERGQCDLCRGGHGKREWSPRGC